MTRILCCGDRNWDSFDIIKRELRKFDSDTVIINGGARGADTISKYIGKTFSFAIITFHANWNKYGIAAGIIRNTQMLNKGNPDLVLAFHNNIENSKGTKNMVMQSKKKGIKTIIIKE